MKFFKCTHPEAVYPERQTALSAGYDVTAIDNGEEKYGCLVYDTGISVGELPANHIIKLYARSSIRKMDLRLTNGVGIIDPDFPGTIQVTFDVDEGVSWGDLKKYAKGDRIGQLVVEPVAHEQDRVDIARTGGHGSTGIALKKKRSRTKKEKK